MLGQWTFSMAFRGIALPFGRCTHYLLAAAAGASAVAIFSGTREWKKKHYSCDCKRHVNLAAVAHAHRSPFHKGFGIFVHFLYLQKNEFALDVK